MAQLQQHIELARSLPPRLIRLFTRWPPQQLKAATQATTPSIESAAVATVSNTSSADPNVGAPSTEEPVTTSPRPQYLPANTTHKVNPFLPFRNPRTGCWHGPHYSLRRQAELFKLAVKHNVLSLMPESPKHPEIKERRRIERGLRMQGTGEGQRVKGKEWERTLQSRLEKRRKAMEGMPEMIREWKQKGHGRGWKKWPR